MENVTANPLNLIMIMALMGLLPFMVTLMTSYIKIIVVTFLIRNALGVQQVPPSMVLSGLALILSIFVMAPVAMQTYNLLEKEQIDTASITPAQIIETASNVSGPIKTFLKNNTSEEILKSFTNTAQRIWPEDLKKSIDEDSFVIIIPSFVISELTKAFQIGFLLYLPFIAIDLIISNILLAMGMMMVPPVMISLPFKVLIFVLVDGFNLLIGSLVNSFK